MNIVALLKQELLATLEKCPPEIATIRWPTFPKRKAKKKSTDKEKNCVCYFKRALTVVIAEASI